MVGQYKAVFRGSGIEFEEVSDYTPADKVKNIDWIVLTLQLVLRKTDPNE
jgi:uncharacterized protein (DUF58 family)